MAEAIYRTHVLSCAITHQENATRIDSMVLADYLFSANTECQV